MENIILSIILIALIILEIVSVVLNYRIVNNNKEQDKRSKRFNERMKQLNQEHNLRIIKLNTEIEILKKILKG